LDMCRGIQPWQNEGRLTMDRILKGRILVTTGYQIDGIINVPHRRTSGSMVASAS
jgi:hypothetical protein